MNNLRDKFKTIPRQKVEAIRAKVLSEGVSQPTYDRFLNGKSQNLTCAKLIANELGISVQQLLELNFD